MCKGPGKGKDFGKLRNRGKARVAGAQGVIGQ